MNTITITIENLKCHGCATTITKELKKIDKVQNVSVDVEKSQVEIFYDGDDKVVDSCKAKLHRLGYPEAGNNTTVSKAKSYVSCAIGRLSE